MIRPLVSIIIPCYNAEKWVEESIQSALNQTYQNIEIIFVNDGSTDRSLAVVQGFDSSKIKIFSLSENQGLAYALNWGLKHANGEFIQYLDADDMISPNKISRQVELLIGKPTAFSVSPYICFQDGQIPAGEPDCGLMKILRCSKEPIELWLNCHGGNEAFEGTFFPPVCYLLPRQMTQKLGDWFSSQKMLDCEYFLRAKIEASEYCVSWDTLCYYRQSPGSLIRQVNYGAVKGTLEVLKSIEKTLDGNIKGSVFQKRRAMVKQYILLINYSILKFSDIANEAILRLEARGDYVAFLNHRSKFLLKIVGAKNYFLIRCYYGKARMALRGWKKI